MRRKDAIMISCPIAPPNQHSVKLLTAKLKLVFLLFKNNSLFFSTGKVILACMPASSDFANCEAILLAKEFDPHGRRTLGVVTKTDDIQPGSNIKAKLQMEPRQMRLNLGFVAVINRTPIEVKNDTPAEQVRARERRFFTTNAELKGLDKEFWGMDTLVERIVAIQAERIQEVSYCLDRAGCHRPCH